METCGTGTNASRTHLCGRQFKGSGVASLPPQGFINNTRSERTISKCKGAQNSRIHSAQLHGDTTHSVLKLQGLCLRSWVLARCAVSLSLDACDALEWDSRRSEVKRCAYRRQSASSLIAGQGCAARSVVVRLSRYKRPKV